MGSGLSSWDDDDDGLPDAAFTEDELAAGVQHIVRTGDPNATSSGRRPVSRSLESVDDVEGDRDCAEDTDDLLSLRRAATLRFENYALARAWAQANPGRVIARASDGPDFEAKPVPHEQRVNHTQRKIDSYLYRHTEIKALAPHLNDVLSNSASNGNRILMRPFYRSTWQAELSRLSTGQLKRLRLLLAIHLEGSRERLRQVYADMRRFRTMKAGDYGETLSERVNEIKEGAIADIDALLAEGRDA